MWKQDGLIMWPSRCKHSPVEDAETHARLADGEKKQDQDKLLEEQLEQILETLG